MENSLKNQKNNKLFNNFYKDHQGTKYMIQQIIDDIYTCIDLKHNDVVFLTPEQLELIEENNLQEEILNDDEFCYENL